MADDASLRSENEAILAIIPALEHPERDFFHCATDFPEIFSIDDVDRGRSHTMFAAVV
jgi:hypothetical protein